MKKKTVLLTLISLVFLKGGVIYAQTEQPAKQHKFGVGLGYNFNSIMGDTIRPMELSLRYRINNKHTLQLYIPVLRRNQAFRSEAASYHLVQTVLDTKKRAFGIGIEYDYTIYSCSFIDFIVGAKAEYLSFNHETDMSNNHIWTDPDSGHRYGAIDYTFYTRKGNWLSISPEIGIRAEWNRLFFDAKFLLSGVFLKKEFYKRLKTEKYIQNKTESDQVDWTYPATESFKVKPAVSLSVSYYF
ncbi:MAG: hypothetical protein ACOYEG_04270 [Petrimonas sp.]